MAERMTRFFESLINPTAPRFAGGVPRRRQPAEKMPPRVRRLAAVPAPRPAAGGGLAPRRSRTARMDWMAGDVVAAEGRHGALQRRGSLRVRGPAEARGAAEAAA